MEENLLSLLARLLLLTVHPCGFSWREDLKMFIQNFLAFSEFSVKAEYINESEEKIWSRLIKT